MPGKTRSQNIKEEHEYYKIANLKNVVKELMDTIEGQDEYIEELFNEIEKLEDEKRILQNRVKKLSKKNNVEEE